MPDLRRDAKHRKSSSSGRNEERKERVRLRELMGKKGGRREVECFFTRLAPGELCV